MFDSEPRQILPRWRPEGWRREDGTVRILIINTDYPAFLSSHYATQAGLADASFDEQLRARNESFFGVFDAYSRGFAINGHEAREVHANNGLIQRRYMLEAGRRAPRRLRIPPRVEFLAWRVASRLLPLPQNSRAVLRSPFDIAPWQLTDILLTQVQDYRPDVILNQSVSEVGSDLLDRMKPFTKLIVGQIASPEPDGEDYHAYDLMVSSLPNFVERYRKRGMPAELSRLGFDDRILNAVKVPARDVDVSFVGSLSPAHPVRARLIEWLAGQTRLDIWGNGVEQFPHASAVHRHYHGEAWGTDMFTALGRSKMTINNHIGIAENYANNMRLYEATGMGCLLLNDRKSNIEDMFEPGREIVCYNTPEECLDLIRHYSGNDAERNRIAAASQRRTLTEHNYTNRTAELIELFQLHLSDRSDRRHRIRST